MDGGFAAAGIPVLFAALTVIEAGVPLPVPGDVLMLLVGERTAAHAVPLWVAVAGLEGVVITGTAALFLAARGPLRQLIVRSGRRVGLTQQRLERATNVLEHRGQAAIALGRATPSLRTLTVIAAAASRLSARRALPLLVLGGSVFIQLHLVLGYLLGPAAESMFKRAQLPVLVVVVVLVIAAAVYWVIRRGRRRAAQAWSEAICPACIALHLAPAGARLKRAAD
jgi:membrane protein DedA with SNARE-associated domain